MTRLTLIGAMYITFICLIPEFMRDAMKETEEDDCSRIE
ncbi:hypothetical protein [Rahnella bonaserana]